MTQQELLKEQLLLNALHNAQHVIEDLNRNQITGEIDRTYAGNDFIKKAMQAINEACVNIYDRTRSQFWWDK